MTCFSRQQKLKTLFAAIIISFTLSCSFSETSAFECKRIEQSKSTIPLMVDLRLNESLKKLSFNYLSEVLYKNDKSDIARAEIETFSTIWNLYFDKPNMSLFISKRYPASTNQPAYSYKCKTL